jgi:hypothetical protein
VRCTLATRCVLFVLERGKVTIKHEARKEERATTGVAGEAWHALTDALGIPRSKRGHKLKQAEQFARIVENGLDGEGGGEVRILDVACGRSYLGFVLYHMLSAGGYRPRLHGIDANATLVEKCCEISRGLGWKDCDFNATDLAQYEPETGAYDVLVSLHGCDTLSDDAIRVGVEGRIPLLFVAPCCQQELRKAWGPHPLEWMGRYGVLEERFADILTDGYRSLVLEARGYRVTVVRFVAPEVTPKNLLIQAKLTAKGLPERAEEAREFERLFSVRPRLASLLADGADAR